MDALIDITTIHRIGKIIYSKENERVRAIDIVALLHFVELILFCDNIYFTQIEGEKTVPLTSKIIESLMKYGCIPKDNFNSCMLKPIKSKYDDHYDFHVVAANKCANILYTLKNDNLFKQLPKYFDCASQPDGVRIDNIYKLLESKDIHEPISNEFLLELIKDDFVLGSTKSILFSSRELQLQLKQLYKKPNFQYDYLFRTMFRIKANEAIANKFNCIYSPAPQRAIFDQIIYRSILSDMNKSILSIRNELGLRKYFDGVFKKYVISEEYPFPALVIGILLENKLNEPIEMLQWACKYREESNELNNIRMYINELERLNMTGNYSDQKNVKDNIKNVIYEVRQNLDNNFVKSIFRSSLKNFLSLINVNNDGNMTDEEIDNYLRLFRSKKYEKILPTNFLSIITNNLLSESELGAWLSSSLKREIY